MGATEGRDGFQRGVGRRKEDWLVRERLRRHGMLFRVGQVITSEMNLAALFEVIMDQTNRMLGTQRSTVFLHDSATGELWSLVATAMQRNEIRIPEDHGVAGWVFQHRLPARINDAYGDPRFYGAVDRHSGFRTRNLLCVPLFDQGRRCVGVLEALNKEEGEFSDDDEELLGAMSHYVAIALENSRLYEEVKAHAERLHRTLVHLETLEKVKSQLTKFVPSSVARLLEQDPGRLDLEKAPAEVTILFIDIQEFSRITQAFDPRVVNDMVESHFSRYLECVRRHGGEVNEVAGDGLMVIFREGEAGPHPREAVTAALEIIEENGRLNEANAYPWGPVALHLGINSGQAWVGSTKMRSLAGERWTYTASGMVTVLAARIGALSSGTRLFIGPQTYQFVHDDFVCEPLGEREMKNVQGPIAVYWVRQAARAGSPGA